MDRRFYKSQIDALRVGNPREAEDIATWKRGAALTQVAAGWDDIQAPIFSTVGGSSLATILYRDTLARIPVFSSNGTDYTTVYIQMSHRWDPTSSIKLHIHWIPLELPAANRIVLFEVSYAWVRPGGVLPAAASWTNVSVQETVLTTDQYKHKITPLATIGAPASGEASDILAATVRRNGASVVDTYTDGGTANVGLLSIDAHYQSTRTGTYTEY